MEEKYLAKLEYFEILKQLSHYATTFLGKEKVAKLMPFTEKEVIQSSLAETEEAFLLLLRKGSIPISAISDIRMDIQLLENGGTLSGKSLLAIARILKIAFRTKGILGI